MNRTPVIASVLEQQCLLVAKYVMYCNVMVYNGALICVHRCFDVPLRTKVFYSNLVLIVRERGLLKGFPIHGPVAKTVHLQLPIRVRRSLPSEFNTKFVIFRRFNCCLELRFGGHTSVCSCCFGSAAHAVALPGNCCHLKSVLETDTVIHHFVII